MVIYYGVMVVQTEIFVIAAENCSKHKSFRVQADPSFTTPPYVFVENVGNNFLRPSECDRAVGINDLSPDEMTGMIRVIERPQTLLNVLKRQIPCLIYCSANCQNRTRFKSNGR